MTEEITKGGKTLFVCSLCKRVYATKDRAEFCEQWCRANGRGDDLVTVNKDYVEDF